MGRHPHSVPLWNEARAASRDADARFRGNFGADSAPNLVAKANLAELAGPASVEIA